MRRPTLAAALAWLSGCGDGGAPAPPPDAAPARPCPAGWVAGARGGCGPAVLFCAPDGGAAADACAGVDPARPAPIALANGGTVAGFRRLADGGVGGAWPEPGDPSGPGLASCPAGWRRTDDGACDPALRDDCPPGTAALPGARCTPTGEADCPAGDFAEVPEGVDAARVVYARAGADAAAADGSRAAPFATLTAALEGAPEGGVVLLARGAYRERIRINRSVSVLGACAARVTLDGADLASAGPVVVNVLGEGVRVTLAGVTVRGAAAGVRSHFGAHVRVERVVVDGGEIDGLYAYEAGSVLEAVGSVVRGVRERTALMGGFGLDAFDGGSVRATDVAVERATAFGVAVRLRGEVTLERCVVRDTQRGAGGDSFGAVVRTGASLTASETVFTENRTVNISGQEGGATLTLRDVAVLGGAAAPGGAGVQVYGGATLRATGLQVIGARGAGVSANGAGTSASLTASLVRRTNPLANNGGQGLFVDEGAALVASSTAVEASVGQGALARGAGSSLTLEGCAVRDTAATPTLHNGTGLLALAGASLRARSVVVERSVSFGLIAHGEGTAVSLAGSAVRDTRHDAWGAEGKGAAVSVGASLDLTGVVVADSLEEGVFATAAGTRLTARDLLVLGTRPSDGGLGHAILIDGARSELERVALQGCAGAGLLVSGSNRAEAPTVVRDLVVREVRPGTIRSVFEGATRRPFGPLVSYGIHANYGGAVAVTGALVDVGDLGLFNAGGALSLTDAVVSRQREGIGGYAAGTPPSATTLVRVVSVDNVDGALRLRNDLPAAASLGAPVDPCADGCL